MSARLLSADDYLEAIRGGHAPRDLTAREQLHIKDVLERECGHPAYHVLVDDHARAQLIPAYCARCRRAETERKGNMEQTFNQLINEAIARATERRTSATTSEEGRDLSLSITHLEDARTRFNSSCYRRTGNHYIHDPELGDRAQ